MTLQIALLWAGSLLGFFWLGFGACSMFGIGPLTDARIDAAEARAAMARLIAAHREIPLEQAMQQVDTWAQSHYGGPRLGSTPITGEPATRRSEEAP